MALEFGHVRVLEDRGQVSVAHHAAVEFLHHGFDGGFASQLVLEALRFRGSGLLRRWDKFRLPSEQRKIR